MGWFEEERIVDMKALKKTLFETVDVLEEEADGLLAEIEMKKDEADIMRAELKQEIFEKEKEIDAILNEAGELQFQRTKKLAEISRVEQSIRLVSGKRIQ